MTDSEVLELLRVLEAEVVNLKQMAGVLNKFIAHEGKLEFFSSELETVSDEVVFLRKKLEHDQNKQNKEVDSKIEEFSKRLNRLERGMFETERQDNDLRRSKVDWAARVMELSEAKIQFLLTAREKEFLEQQRRIRALEAELIQLRRPWWKKLFD